MRTALVALDPIATKNRNFRIFCENIRMFQERGLIANVSVGSIIYPAMYMVPLAWYSQNEKEYAAEATKNLESICRGQFSFTGVNVVKGDASGKGYLVEQMSKLAHKSGAEVMVVSSSDQKGLPHWFIGSFAETAALEANLPILVLKPDTVRTDFSKDPRFVIGIDSSAPPTVKDLKWISKVARTANATVDLVSVEPKRRIVVDALQQRKIKADAKKILEEIQARLQRDDVKASVEFLDESTSIAHTIVGFAQKRKAWLTITTSPKRSAARKILLGSSARRILALSKLPFLALRH